MNPLCLVLFMLCIILSVFMLIFILRGVVKQSAFTLSAILLTVVMLSADMLIAVEPKQQMENSSTKAYRIMSIGCY